jgi:hypothetical protein
MRNGTTAIIGDLVILDGDAPLSGIVLETRYWYNERDQEHERDLYVQWANGSRFWCLGRGVDVFCITVE